MSSVDSDKHLGGQPIFKQVLDLMPRNKFDVLVQKKSDRYFKTLNSWIQLTSMLYGILNRCDSLGEICNGMWALGGKLNYLG